MWENNWELWISEEEIDYIITLLTGGRQMCFPTCHFASRCASFTASSPVLRSLIDLPESTPGVTVSFCHLFVLWIYLPMDWSALPGRPPPRWTNVPEISGNVCSLHYSWPQFGHQSLSKTSPELVLTVLLQLSVWCVSHPIICPMSMTDTWREKLGVSVSPVHRVRRSVCFSLVPSCGTKCLFWNNHRWRAVL